MTSTHALSADIPNESKPKSHETLVGAHEKRSHHYHLLREVAPVTSLFMEDYEALVLPGNAAAPTLRECKAVTGTRPSKVTFVENNPSVYARFGQQMKTLPHRWRAWQGELGEYLKKNDWKVPAYFDGDTESSGTSRSAEISHFDHFRRVIDGIEHPAGLYGLTLSQQTTGGPGYIIPECYRLAQRLRGRGYHLVAAVRHYNLKQGDWLGFDNNSGGGVVRFVVGYFRARQRPGILWITDETSVTLRHLRGWLSPDEMHALFERRHFSGPDHLPTGLYRNASSA